MSDIPDSYFINRGGKHVELMDFRREPDLGPFAPGEAVKKKRRSRGGPPKRSALILRDGMICHYCKTKMEMPKHRGPHSATVEHIVPRSLGGSNEMYNLVLACSDCNSSRGSEYYKCNCVLCKEARRKHECSI